MQRWLLIPFTVISILVATTAVAIAQDDSTASQPIVITVEQAAPVKVTLSIPMDDGTLMTTTVPLTVTTNLKITIAGNQVIGVEQLPGAAVTVSAEDGAIAAKPSTAEQAATPAGAADGQLVDSAGMPYAAQLPDGLQVVKVTSKDTFGKFGVVGQLLNTGSTPISYIMVSTPVYDADGGLLDLGVGAATLANPLKPGAKTSFTVLSGAAMEEVASYELQFEAGQ